MCDKNPSKMRMKGTYLNIIKAMKSNSRAKIILSGKKVKAFPLRSRTRQECPLLPLLLCLEVLAEVIRQEKI